MVVILDCSCPSMFHLFHSQRHHQTPEPWKSSSKERSGEAGLETLQVPIRTASMQ